MNNSDTACPICGNKVEVQRRFEPRHVPNGDSPCGTATHASDAIYLKCPVCGMFVITEHDYHNLKLECATSDRAHHLSALIREQTIRDLPPFWIMRTKEPDSSLEVPNVTSIDVKELLDQWPRTVPGRMDRTLCNLGYMSSEGGARIDLTIQDYSVAFAKSESEAFYHLRSLEMRGLLILDNVQGYLAYHVVVSSDGWARIDDLTRDRSNLQNPAFVAMWFGGDSERKEMDATFKDAIHPAIVAAGYKAHRSDTAEHNDWVMDKILGDIRVAPFVVADFTANRNGVYFEAGFARGLGLQVIHTCRKDYFEKAHFDIQQLFTIVWETPEELHKRLYNRILGTVGPGPYPPAER